MAEQAAKMADQAMNGKAVDQSEENPYDVPAYLYEPTKVTLKNYKEQLFDSGLFVKNKDGAISAVKNTDEKEDDSNPSDADSSADAAEKTKEN